MTYEDQYAPNVGGEFARSADDCEDSPSTAASSRHDGWTPEVRVKFLDALAECGNVTSAAHYVQRSRSSAYNLKRRDADFSRTWDAALLIALDGATDVLQDRAINGIAEDVYRGGEVVGTRQRYEIRYLLAHIARLEKLAERASVSRGAARFDQMIDAIAAGEDTSVFISEPTDDELVNITADAIAKSTALQIEAECEHHREVALYKALEAEQVAEEEAEEAAMEAEIEAEYGPTYEIDWADGKPLDYGHFFEEDARKLCAKHPHITLRRVAHDDPRLVAAMGWPLTAACKAKMAEAEAEAENGEMTGAPAP